MAAAYPRSAHTASVSRISCEEGEGSLSHFLDRDEPHAVVVAKRAFGLPAGRAGQVAANLGAVIWG